MKKSLTDWFVLFMVKTLEKKLYGGPVEKNDECSGISYCYQEDSERAYAPHCNETVLHAPGICHYCDVYPDWQEARTAAGQEFSPTDLPWPGNRPEGHAGPQLN